MNRDHTYWMDLALREAEVAMEHGEIPVASILVGDGKEICRGQTQVKRRGSIAAHGELFALLDAKEKVYTSSRPLVMYTTLEPCLMCLGAMMQTEIDTVVYGMDAAPDGGTRFVNAIKSAGQEAPMVIAHILEAEQVALMRSYLRNYAEASGAPYVRALLARYDGR